ncbi:MAG: GAF domain-containing sensor histidine kinase [Ktedonobacterales bacterium]
MARYINNYNGPLNGASGPGAPGGAHEPDNHSGAFGVRNQNTFTGTGGGNGVGAVGNVRGTNWGAAPTRAAATSIIRNESEVERLQRRSRQLEEQSYALLMALEGVANTLSAEVDLPPLLRRIAQVAVRLTAAHVGVVYLLDQEGGLLVEAVETAQSAADSNVFGPLEASDPANSMLAESNSPSAGRMRIVPGQGIVSWVAQSGELALVSSPESDPRFDANAVATDAAVLGLRPGGIIGAPIIFKGAVTGVLEVAKAEDAEVFDMRSLDLMRTLAAQAAVAIANARLYRRLRSEHDRIIQTQEDERKRLGHQLHDGPAQMLAQIVMTLELAERLAMSERGEPQLAIAEMRKARELALATTRDIRALLFDLRPLVLESESGGLVAALRQSLERYANGNGPQMRLDAHYPERLPHTVELTVFAIVQEAVNNIIKHAHAQNCVIEIRESPARLLATIRDDGDGFDTAQIQVDYETRGSWGMVNMLERAGLINGELSIASQVGKGTIVTLDVPRE